jgi:hypothetical protein
MRLDTLKKRLNNEFKFSESYETLNVDSFEPGDILLTPHYREQQRPWIQKAYDEWLKGDRTVVLICPLKINCIYFKKYVNDVAEVRHIKEPLSYNNHRVTKPMIIAIYNKRMTQIPNFIVSFN